MSGLTVTDVFDLFAEHADCASPNACLDGWYAPLGCPQHAALEGKRWAYRMPMLPQKYLPFAGIQNHLRGWDGETPRVVIAVLLWRITAEFAHDDEALHPAPGQTITDAAEQYVRDHWVEAESNGVVIDGFSTPISRYLDSLSLYDDYRRVRASDQHKAFANPEETR